MITTQQLRNLVEKERKSLCWGLPPSNDLGVLTRSIDELQGAVTFFAILMIKGIHYEGWLKLFSIGFLVMIIICTVKIIKLMKIRNMMIEKNIVTVEGIEQKKES